ncbi:MAG: metal-dependent hydrolase [Hyphomicrobiaceae bacterium]|nr:metal-dependent hydrolase [Hyphomicrobiaceae bacterium]
MATIFSHPAIAIGLFPWFRDVRNSKAIMITGLLLTAAPDLDVIGLRLGIPYEHMLGHRGLTHSLFFAAAIAALLTALFWLAQKMKAWAVWLYLFLSMASHGVLDALTNGGLGVAFFAPFHNERYFFPYRPIEVSTLSIRHFFESQGAGVLLNELTYIWPPCLAVLLIGYFWQKTI